MDTAAEGLGRKQDLFLTVLCCVQAWLPMPSAGGEILLQTKVRQLGDASVLQASFKSLSLQII